MSMIWIRPAVDVIRVKYGSEIFRREMYEPKKMQNRSGNGHRCVRIQAPSLWQRWLGSTGKRMHIYCTKSRTLGRTIQPLKLTHYTEGDVKYTPRSLGGEKYQKVATEEVSVP